MTDETIVTFLVPAEDLLRLEKALRGASEYLSDEDTPPSIREDVRNGLRLVEAIRGR